MSKLSEKELNILGEGYQLTFDERVERIGGDKLEAITIANTWQWFKIASLERDVPNQETRDLLLVLAEDIDRLDDMCRKFPFQNEKEQLLTLIFGNHKLHKKIDLHRFGKHIKKGNNILYTLNYVLNKNVEYFNYVINEINYETDDYITVEDWVESSYVDFNPITNIRLKKGSSEL